MATVAGGGSSCATTRGRAEQQRRPAEDGDGAATEDDGGGAATEDDCAARPRKIPAAAAQQIPVNRWASEGFDKEVAQQSNRSLARKCNVQRRDLEEKETLTLNFGSVYHVMNSTCIHHEGYRPEYIHVQVLGNMHKTPYTMGKLQDTHIYLTISSQRSLCKLLSLQ